MASSFSTSAPSPVTDSHRRQPLHCPRCNSSNTKFCYYNNYSLSQPRHYCKACKRYWTRGGTLRNVPVGGGCRQNKKLKLPPPTAGGASRSSPPSDHGVYNPLIYGLQSSNNLLQQQPPSRFSSLSSAVVRSENPGFDFQLETSDFRLEFPSGPPFGSSAPPFSSTPGNNSALYGSSGFSSSSAMAASLLASSTFQPQKKETSGNFNDVISNVSSSSMPSEGEQMASHHHKVVEVGESGLNNPNPIDHLISSDPSSLLWSTTNLGVGAWLDPSNSILGSSISSMI